MEGHINAGCAEGGYRAYGRFAPDKAALQGSASANFPDWLKFAYQYLLLKEGEWLEACRIDNYRHDKKKTGTHMHKYGSQFVEFRELSFKEAESVSIEIGNRIKAAIKGEQNG